MSTHEALAVRITEILPHTDPETVRLGLTKVFDYTIVIAKESWKVGDLAIYIEPDVIVKTTRPEFSFLANPQKPERTTHRVSAKRLRGIWSEGCLIPAPENAKEGQDFWKELELERYEPPLKTYRSGPKSGPNQFVANDIAEPPQLPLPERFEIENYKKHSKIFGPEKLWSRKPSVNEEGIFDPGEFILDPNYSPPEICITCKIHGSFSCFVFDGNQMHYGSKNQWKKPEEKNLWFEAVKQNPWIEEWCRKNPCMFLMGEVFGHQGGFSYGLKSGSVGFRAFDVWDSEPKSFWDHERMMNSFNLFIEVQKDNGRTAPILYVGPYNDEIVKQQTDGLSLIEGASHIREGCIVKPRKETVSRYGRHILKSVSNDYYLR